MHALDDVLDRRHRTLRRVNISDAAMAESVFELLMGNDVAPRKDFITQNSSTSPLLTTPAAPRPCKNFAPTSNNICSRILVHDQMKSG